MANIPVERKNSPAWWMWLLALLVLALVIWLLWSWFADDEEEAVVTPVAVEEPVETLPPAEPTGVVDQLALLTAADAASYIGQRVDLDDLQVESVLGDLTFTVSSPDTADQLLVVLDQTPSPDVPGIEGQVDVNEGQTLDVTGTVQAMPASPAEQWQVPQDRAQELAQHTVYVQADEVSITEAETDQPVEVEEVQ